MKPGSLDSRGVLQLPLAAILVISTATALTLLGLSLHWRHLVELQLRLDTCVGNTSLALKTRLNSIDRLNSEIRILRVAIAVSPPHLKPPLQTALAALAISQEFLIQEWKIKQIAWISMRGCDGKSDLALPLPGLHYSRAPPDAIGPQIASWDSGESKELRIRIRRASRFAAAEIGKTGSSGKDSYAVSNRKNWKSQWTDFY